LVWSISLTFDFFFWIVWLMVFNASFNNISAILWQSVLLVEKTTDLSQVTDKLYHTSPWSWFELTTLVLIGTDCIGRCKSNYHTITATTPPCQIYFWRLVLYIFSLKGLIFIPERNQVMRVQTKLFVFNIHKFGKQIYIYINQ
jgi:hypothetical protein